MKRKNEILVGILVAVSLVVLVVGTIWLLRGGLSSGYPMHARFAWGSNLKPGQTVNLAGVAIGYVSEVDLANDGFLDVEMRIYDKYRIPTGSTATVTPVGFFGDVTITITPPGKGITSAIPEGDTLRAGVPPVSITDALARVDTIGRSVQALTTALQTELVAAGGLQDIRKTLANTERLTAQLSSIAAEQSRQLSATLASVRRSASALDSAEIAQTLTNARQTSANVAALSAQLDSTTRQLDVVVRRLNAGQGTAGKLLNDEALYNDMRRLLIRLDSLTADFQRNPRKYINLEIF